MKYKIHVATEDGELLDTIDIDTSVKNWNSNPTKKLLMDDVFREFDLHKNRCLKEDRKIGG